MTEEIKASQKGNQLLVSICCITYNHASYIKECLDGFIIQKTDFPIEVLIYDDASTDGAQDIIREYETKYPDIIKPIYQTENQYSKGCSVNRIFNFSRARGKYIALCEGDDYWTDPLKLQKQVDFLEANQEYSMCFHNALVTSEIDKSKKLFHSLEQREYFPKEIIQWIIPTCSAVIKAEVVFTYPKVKFHAGDTPLFIHCTLHGRIYCIAEVMSVYRQHSSGWTSNAKSLLFKNLMEDYIKMKKIFPSTYSDIIEEKIVLNSVSATISLIKESDKAFIPILLKGFLKPKYMKLLSVWCYRIITNKINP